MEPPPENGWEAETRELVAARMCNDRQAREQVTLHYLYDGDCRPLLDWALRGHIHTANVLCCLAAMLDRRYRRGDFADIRYEFGFHKVQKRGRPKRAQVPSLADQIANFLARRTELVANGMDPGAKFWRFLTSAVAQGNPHLVWTKAQTSFPLAAKLQEIEGGRGRRLDPELPIRGRAIGHLVQQKIDKGEKYEMAIAAVVNEIAEQGQREGWRGWVTSRTVRDAYDCHAKKTRRGK
jgi:hypothetical protein